MKWKETRIGTVIAAVAIMGLTIGGCAGPESKVPPGSETARDRETVGNGYTGSQWGYRDEIHINQLAYYEAAMLTDWHESDHAGYDWFTAWTYFRRPTVAIAGDATRAQENTVRRAVAVINRALPADMQMKITKGRSRLPENAYEMSAEDVLDSVGRGNILVDFVSDVGGWAGWAWGNGEKGYVLIDEGELTGEGNWLWKLEDTVKTIVHELIHAGGFGGHPQGMAHSWMSYTDLDAGVMRENLPLIDVAMLMFKMDRTPGRGNWDNRDGWGRWSHRIETVYGAVDGMQFGVHSFNGYDVPWVDAGVMWPVEAAKLEGRATWDGEFVGVDSSDEKVWGLTEIGINFGTESGTIRFDNLRYWGESASWGIPFEYRLRMREHWFESTDVEPDVNGAIYGRDGDIAAGTLERVNLTGAFGAEKSP